MLLFLFWHRISRSRGGQIKPFWFFIHERLIVFFLQDKEKRAYCHVVPGMNNLQVRQPKEEKERLLHSDQLCTREGIYLI